MGLIFVSRMIHWINQPIFNPLRIQRGLIRCIRDARNAEKLTLEQLAEKCECSSKHIGDVERGTVSASWPLAVKIGKALNTGVDYYLADTSDQYFDIQIDVEISNILKDCDMETRMAIRDTARRIAEYGKKIQAKNK